MRNIFTLLVLLIITISINAQTWQWANNPVTTASGHDYSYSITTDINSNIYITGFYDSPSIQFGSTTALTSTVGNMFVAKYDTLGNAIWTRSVPVGNYETARCITTDASGNVYIIGYFTTSTIQFGTNPVLTNSGSADIFIVKYDTNGNAIWSRRAGGNSYDLGHYITTDANANVYITGFYSSPSIQFGSTTALTNIGGYDVFIAKYDSSGTALWSKKAGGSSIDIGYSLKTDSNLNLYVTGWFRSSTIQFGSTSTLVNDNSSFNDMFIAKYDASGTALWSRRAGGSSSDEGRGIAIDTDDNVYVIGNSLSPTIQFGTNAALTGTSVDVFLVKYDDLGNAIWSHREGGIGADYPTSIFYDSNNKLYLTGYYASPSIQFGSTSILSNVGANDLFIAKYDTSGNANWGITIGSTNDDLCYGVTEDVNGNMYTTGNFASSSLQFGSTILTNPYGGTTGTNDLFIARFSPNSSISIAASSASSNPSLICSGSTTTLNLSGGTLGMGSTWSWYSGSCGGIFEGTGATLTPMPNITTTYFVRAEGSGSPTTCVSTTVTVNASSIEADSASATVPLICNAGSTVLNSIGGTLGLSSNWFWYENSCGGTSIGTGILTTQVPTIATTYYVRAEGSCNTTTCVTVYVFVDSLSVSATSASGLPSSLCSGMSTVLTFTDGSLSSGNWFWYENSCGGILVGTGVTTTQNPTTTTLYYVRAEGICNTTGCVSTTIFVGSQSLTISSVLASPSVLCSGSSTLSVTGNLGSSGNWYWYSGSCGGTLIETGISIIQTPTVTTNYYVRAESICNSTACLTLIVTLNSNSLPATSVSATFDVICNGTSTVLSLNGGNLGTTANWYWYSGSCGNSSYIGTGVLITQSPTITTTYYLRAEGSCNTTICVSKTITVNTISINATSVSAMPPMICNGSSTTLNVNGGSLGTNGNWYWYTGACGGTLVGTGISIVQSPTITTTYFVRAEDLCSSLTCLSTIVTLNIYSTQATAVNASPSAICIGGTSLLSISGGTIDSLGNWYWYSGSCGGGNSIGTGISIIQSPTITTTYFVRAEGTCNTTGCVTVNVSLKILSLTATSVSATVDTLCIGNPSVISISGGTLGTSANWIWYSGSCGFGSSIGTGTSTTQILTVTTTYYVRAEGACNTTTCISKTITVDLQLISATSATALPDTICIGGTTVLSVVGGTLSSLGNWNWYTGSCGGTLLSSGTSTIQIPTITTTYFVRAEDQCNSTNCVSIIIILNMSSIQSTSISALPDTICIGGTTVLSITGGTLSSLGNWFWYTGSCGGTLLSSGASTVQNPTITTTYFVRAEDQCNSTNCVSIIITLNVSSTQAISISALPDTICIGGTTILSITGGTLGTSANWYWYSGSCGNSSFIGTGLSTTQSPMVSTTYYVRAEGICNTTACVSHSVIINSISSAATSISASQADICSGSSIVLNIIGGSLGIVDNWYWYSSTCGGTVIGTGVSTTQSPTVSTTYYVRAQGPCSITTCNSIRIAVITAPVLTGNIIGNFNTIVGNIENYAVTNIPGASYTWTAPSGWIGNSVTDNISYTVGTASGDITVVASNMCGTSQVLSQYVSITVGINKLESNKFYISNHPNPFINLTNIEFEIPESGIIRIELYNILGEKITNIANGYYLQGKHIITFDGSKLDNGIYFYKINAILNNKEYNKTKIMNIVK